MRVLSILCGLSFAVTAGYLLAFSLILSLAELPPQTLALTGRGFAPLTWPMRALALLGGATALRARCEGWVPLVIGCGLFLLWQLLPTGLNLGALLCIAAAGFALLPLIHTPSSYWRVAG